MKICENDLFGQWCDLVCQILWIGPVECCTDYADLVQDHSDLVDQPRGKLCR